MQTDLEHIEKHMRERFHTIDDAIDLADTLLRRLKQLGSYKHPLLIRRARKGVKYMNDNQADSRMLKAGARTYFFDVKQTKDGKGYLVITESRLTGETGERERSTIVVFPEQAAAFSKHVSEVTDQIAEESEG